MLLGDEDLSTAFRNNAHILPADTDQVKIPDQKVTKDVPMVATPVSLCLACI